MANTARQFKHPIPGTKQAKIRTSDDILNVWKPSDGIETITWNGLYIDVKTLLSIREISMFINNVMDLCFDEEHEIAIPEAADFAIRINVLIMYAGISLTCSIDEQYKIVYESGIYESICEKINQSQLESIRQTVHTCVLHMM